MSKSIFERLSAINVNNHVEKKKDLTYLSWAWAWSETKKACPDATYKIKETEYDHDLGFMCHTTVTIEGDTLEMWLPVMDGANKSMKKYPYEYNGFEWQNGKRVQVKKLVEAATTFDINKTIMRCLVKNLAMFGLGIYIYAGEDLPEADTIEAKQSMPEQTSANSTQKSVPPKLQNPGESKPTLTKKHEGYDKVVKYMTDNKSLGISDLLQQVSRKFVITPAMQKELEKIIA